MKSKQIDANFLRIILNVFYFYFFFFLSTHSHPQWCRLVYKKRWGVVNKEKHRLSERLSLIQLDELSTFMHPLTIYQHINQKTGGVSRTDRMHKTIVSNRIDRSRIDQQVCYLRAFVIVFLIASIVASFLLFARRFKIFVGSFFWFWFYLCRGGNSLGYWIKIS